MKPASPSPTKRDADLQPPPPQSAHQRRFGYCVYAQEDTYTCTICAGGSVMGALIEKAGTAVPSEEDARLAAESSRVLALRRPDQDIGVYAFEGSEKRGQSELLCHPPPMGPWLLIQII